MEFGFNRKERNNWDKVVEDQSFRLDGINRSNLASFEIYKLSGLDELYSTLLDEFGEEVHVGLIPHPQSSLTSSIVPKTG